ncbi:MAG: cupredoxin domain-containing protein [Candidatus Tectomicrobia bacterium]|nr:cupredoxin domain-containing protein [Candidatus Tectomicrobia bacterium]
MKQRYLIVSIVSFLAIGAMGGLFLPTSAYNQKSMQEITLVAKNTRFNETNPIVVLHRGDQVQMTIRNDEPPGTPHNLFIAGLDVKTSKILQPGESETITFTPNRQGTFTYSCLLHPGMMDGQVVVQKR